MGIGISLKKEIVTLHAFLDWQKTWVYGLVSVRLAIYEDVFGSLKPSTHSVI